MLEVEKHRQQKKELEKVLEGGDGTVPEEKSKMEEVTEPASNKPDRNMRVCEVCGAL